jgi:hypothetical protein
MTAEIVGFPAPRPARMRLHTDPKCKRPLPFERRKKRGVDHSFWVVTPTDDFWADFEEGKLWAKMFLPFLRYNVGVPMLSWIVDDMIAAGQTNGLVVGFIQGIGRAATRA